MKVEQRIRQLNKQSQRLTGLASACGVMAAVLLVGQLILVSETVNRVFLERKMLADVLPLLLLTLPKLDRRQQGSRWFKALESRGVLVQVWPVDQQVGTLGGLHRITDNFRRIAGRAQCNIMRKERCTDNVGVAMDSVCAPHHGDGRLIVGERLDRRVIHLIG